MKVLRVIDLAASSHLPHFQFRVEFSALEHRYEYKIESIHEHNRTYHNPA